MLVSMRFSHFIASKIVPQAVVLYAGGCGTLGTQALPPGTTSVRIAVTGIAGRLARVRVLLINGIAAATLPVRRYPSAASMSFSATAKKTYVPLPPLARIAK